MNGVLSKLALTALDETRCMWSGKNPENIENMESQGKLSKIAHVMEESGKVIFSQPEVLKL